ncbi:MAG TPA: SIMPL domain-containing protein [Allosphingosinicella sp.]|nr:SIMPL domain-containing protein [Allosphingosinicella sp.]
MRSMLVPLILCTALTACAGEPDPRGVDSDEVLLQVVATGRADTRPNEARFTAGVQTIAPTAAAASAGNNAVMNRVAAALDRLGVKPDDLQTRQITLQRIDYGPERGRFQANNMVEVRVRDVRRAGEAISATTEAGANVLSGPNMTVSDPEAANRSAYAQAYKSARARAEAYAEAAGLKVARVLAISDNGEGGGPIPYPVTRTMAVDAVAAQEAPPPPPMRPGMTTSEVRVRAEFALAAR